MYIKLMSWYTCCAYIFITILYIDFAFPIFTKEKFNEIIEPLISSCDPSNCHSTDIAQIITQGYSSQYDQILHILNEKGPLCIRFALEAVKTQIDPYNRLSTRTCESLTDEDKEACEDTQNKYAAASDRVLSLVNLMVSHQPNLINSLALHLEDKTSSLDSNIRLPHLLQTLEDERSCSQYKIGEERRFIITPVQSGILPFTYYRVKRESENHYKAFVTLEFSPDASYQDGFPVPRSQVYDFYMARIKYRVHQANLKMKGPNGEALEIVIEDAHQVNLCKPRHSIKVGSIINKPASVIYFHSAMSRSLELHEIVHFLGLWDDNNKIQNIQGSDYDCRVLQDNSILGGHEKRWRNIFSRSINNSFLDPSHFHAILYGNCSLRNNVHLYRQCSHLAYQNSNDNSACLEQKAYCESQNILGRDKTAEQNRINAEIQELQAELKSLKDDLEAKPSRPLSHPKYNRRKTTELTY